MQCPSIAAFLCLMVGPGGFLSIYSPNLDRYLSAIHHHPFMTQCQSFQGIS